MKNKTKKSKKPEFKWNVWIWNVNHDNLEAYDVVPLFLMVLKRLKKNERPKTKREFDDFLHRNAQYYFWAKCEWEMIIHGWPKFKNDEKVDVYQQLMLNWDTFVDTFWNSLKK